MKTLTERESVVLDFMAEGLSSKEIARRMNICVTTVISHRNRIRRKLKAKNSLEAIAIAYKLNLLQAQRHPHK